MSSMGSFSGGGGPGSGNRAARRAAQKQAGSLRRSRSRKVAQLTLGGVAATSGLGLAAVPSAEAAGFVVTNINDSGAGSLRDAIDQANANAGPDIITFDSTVTGTISLTTQLMVDDDLIIDGPGARSLTVSGQNLTRVFHLYSYYDDPSITVSIDELTIADGNAVGSSGGGIRTFNTNLTLDSVSVVNNTALERGGGLYFNPYYDGTVLEIVDSVFSGNSADNGGAIAVDATYNYEGASVHIADTSIIENTATGIGGGVFQVVADNTLIERSTISDNEADTFGGGIGTIFVVDDATDIGPGPVGVLDPSGGGLHVIDSVVSGNLAGVGGGIGTYLAAGAVVVDGSDIVENTAVAMGGGIGVYQLDAPLQVEDSTISGNATSAGEGPGFGGGIGVFVLGELGGPLNVTSATPLVGPSGFDERVDEIRAQAADAMAADPRDRGSTIESVAALLESGQAGIEVTRSTLSGNTASAGGGLAAVFASVASPILIDSSTVSGNTAQVGGGLAFGMMDDAPVVSHSTVTGNTATDGPGGGIFGGAYGLPADDVVLDHSVVAGNEATTTLEYYESPTPVLLLTGADNDVAGHFTAEWSIIQDPGTAVVADVVGNQLNVDPLLGPLSDNGGPTLTRLPGAGSPALNAGDPSFVEPPATDQRGAARVAEGRIDIGAVEVGPPPPTCTDFTAIHPIRALDTRSGAGGVPAGVKVGPHGEISIQVTGLVGSGSTGVPSTGVNAVALNVTSTEATAPSFVTVWPSGETMPATSNVNTDPGVDVPNMVMAKVGADGRVRLYNDAGSTHLVVDVLGWFGTCGDYVALSPIRALDTRTVGSAAFGAGETRAVPVLGVGGVTGVPAADVEAVVMNVTSTGASAGSFLTVWPSGTVQPNVSNLNTEPGTDVPNLVIAQPGADGRVNVYNDGGTTHVVVDIMGYFNSDSNYVPVTPGRVLDTRTSLGATGPLGAFATRTFAAAGAGLPAPADAASVILNVTSTQATGASFVTAFASDKSAPPTSNLNTEAAVDVANLTIAQVGPDGKVAIYNNAASTHLVGDIFGYFPPEDL